MVTFDFASVDAGINEGFAAAGDDLAPRISMRQRVLANLAESRVARETSQFSNYAEFDRLYEIAGAVDVSSDRGKALFYSGRFPLNQQLALDFA